jgi:hypothetical protein
MKVWLIAIVWVVAACKGKDQDKTLPAKPATASVPTVTVATVLAKDDEAPPFLLIVDDAGSVQLAAAKTWADLDANTLKLSRKSSLDSADKFTREAFAMGQKPIDAVAAWSEGAEIDLATLDDKHPAINSQDDPPPPPEEDSGGTGTAMALDEGKMGKKDSDRAEGQYKMQRVDEDPQLARQQAIEQARAAGILGGVSPSFGIGMPNDDGTPSRTAVTGGIVMKNGKLDRLRAMILISPTAKAIKLIETVRDTNDAIAVSYNGKIRPLHLQFSLRDSSSIPSSSSAWLEARVSSKGITVEAVPDKALEITALDQLGATLDKARAARGYDASTPVDVLVDPDVDVQRFIDVVVALDTAGVTVIGMAGALSSVELARRGHRIPTTHIGQPNAQGDLDKSEIRKVVKNAKPKIASCYETALINAPSLAGTVQVQFFIKPDGTVATADASGISPEVATCVASVVKTLVFPKPKGGGGVQVVYPFTMRN